VRPGNLERPVGGSPTKGGLDVRAVRVTWEREASRFVAVGTNGPSRSILIAAPPPTQGRAEASTPMQDRPEAPRPAPTGFSATELLLAGAGACAAWDVVEIMHKQRQPLSELEVLVTGEQDHEPPRAYRTVTLRFEAGGAGVERQSLERAVAISVERYCSVVATLRGVPEVRTEVSIREESASTDA
jgi:putative redox protein